MADVTDVSTVEAHIPGLEILTCVASDGETYTSKKFANIRAATAMSNDDNDAALNVEFSDAVATINWAGVTDGNLTLVLYGNLGN